MNIRAVIAVVLAAGMVWANACAQTDTESLKEEALNLENEMEGIRDQDDVAPGKYTGMVFKLAGIYKEMGRDTEAIEGYEEGLRLKSWSPKEQFALAELYAKAGRTQEALEKFEFVSQSDASRSLKEKASNKVSLIKKDWKQPKDAEFTDLRDCALYILPVGDCDADLIDKIKGKIEDNFRISVKIMDPVSLPSAGYRDKKDESVQGFYAWLVDGARPSDIEFVMNNAGLAKKDMGSTENMLKFIRGFSVYSQGLAKEFNKYFDKITGRQYRTDQMFSIMIGEKKNIRDKAKYLGIVAITPEDIYEQGSDYIFGSEQEEYGVVSYNRFVGDYFEEAAESDKITERVMKELYSTIGFIFGLERCTSPVCARAYSEDLYWHDRKSAELCRECRSAFKKYLDSKAVNK